MLFWLIVPLCSRLTLLLIGVGCYCWTYSLLELRFALVLMISEPAWLSKCLPDIIDLLSNLNFVFCSLATIFYPR